MNTYNIYCDESSHLLNDNSQVFTIGGVWVDKHKTEKILSELRDIKKRHSLSVSFEAKWTKVSESKEDYYCDLVKYFFDNEELHFRGVVVPDKSVLKHKIFNQDHDTWYYKMFYLLLSFIFKPQSHYNLYLDIKDSRSNEKVVELQRILNIANSENFPVNKAQQIRSHEVEIMQLTDILLGALSYSHRGLKTNNGKRRVVELVEASIGKNILNTSALEEEKFNVLVWKPKS